MTRVNKRTLKTNGEGYSDPTAYKAIKSVHEDERRVSELIRTVKALCELNGFRVKNRIVLKDESTGKIWR